MKKRPADMPIMKARCATCLFNDDIMAAEPEMVARVMQRVLTTGSLHCHSTGYPDGTHLCRGARDLQVRYFAAIEVIEAATDEAWAKKMEAKA